MAVDVRGAGGAGLHADVPRIQIEEEHVQMGAAADHGVGMTSKGYIQAGYVQSGYVGYLAPVGLLQPIVLAEWVAARVAAVLDPLGLNPKLQTDIATLIERIGFGFDFADTGLLVDALASNVYSIHSDTGSVIDALASETDTHWLDRSRVAEAVELALTVVFKDLVQISDRRWVSAALGLQDGSVISEAATVLSESLMQDDLLAVSDLGRINQHGYVSHGYLALGYVGQISIF